jgi:hypothetical protein
MKASPGGHSPVCPAILLFTVPNFFGTDTLDLCNTIFSTNEKDFHMEIPSHGFPVWNKGPSQRKLGRIDIPRLEPVKGEFWGYKQTALGKDSGVEAIYPKAGKEIGQNPGLFQRMAKPD